MESHFDRARDALQAQRIPLGGSPKKFEKAGRKLLITLLSEGLKPDSTVLDIGCGCLRGGYWLIHFLDPACYFGIEPNRDMLDAGINGLLEPGLTELKRPRFDNNADFDFSVFGESFNFFVARSIWTHAPKNHIRTMLDGFGRYSREGGVFVTSYLRSSLLSLDPNGRDYKGDEWVGGGSAARRGTVRHSWRWVQRECGDRGLSVEEIKGREYNFGNQIWLKIKSRAA